ncbi:hypothetical protein M3Y98_00626600 [Aphelenchoides besseyi]|nr:hypothetical protein M3Y98_00626600 [Aphelenchoides besseyi]KAI6208433.1 hypothetical protein M3Y96_00114900 [Aphelenchoides besseyi]
MKQESEQTSKIVQQAEDVNALSELLDEALIDFKKRPQPPPKTSDDDLDDFLAPMDEAATRKAAENFERILREVAIPQAMEGVETEKLNLNDASHEFLCELLGINKFLEEEKVEPEFRSFMESLLKDCFTKDVILPLIKQFKELIDEYLAEKPSILKEEEKRSLIEQQNAFGELVAAYEASDDPPTADQTQKQNNLWAKLRDLGEIPQPLIEQRRHAQFTFVAGTCQRRRCSMFDNMTEPPSYPRFQERSFSLFRAAKNPGVDYLRHPSGIIMILLSEDHQCLTKEISEFSFDTSTKKNGGRDRSKQSVVGKSKKGGLKLSPETKICRITCSDGSVYMIRAGIKATLIEVNAKLLTNPQLLKTSRDYSGYIAIVIPPSVFENQRNRLPSEFNTPIRVALEIASMTEAMAEKPNNEADEDAPPVKVPKES